MTQHTLFDLPSEAQQILERAHAREDARAAVYVPIDYPRAKRENRRLRAQLTRAVNSGDKEQVILACRDASPTGTSQACPGRIPGHTGSAPSTTCSAGWPHGVDLRDLR